MVLSVVIPCWNVADYLGKCLSSMDDDRLDGRLEALIVNDGSTDGTRDIALKYVSRRPGVFRLIDKPNGGHGSAVNAGMDAAGGRYMRIVDGDDWLETAHLQALLDALEGAQADLVIDQKYEDEKETGQERFFPLPSGTPFGQEMPFAAWCGDEMTEYYMLHTMNVRLDFLRALGVRLLEHTYYVDFEYVLKVTSRARSIAFMDLGVYHYLVGNAQQSVAPQNYVRRADQHRRVVEECVRFRKEAAIPPAMTGYVRRRCQLLIHTHLNILLIYDRDRRKGRRAARLFMQWLRAEDKELHALVRRRYGLALVLNRLGFTDETLARVKRRAERQ